MRNTHCRWRSSTQTTPNPWSSCSQDKSIEIRKFDDTLLQALGNASGEVLVEAARKDALTRRTYDSYIVFWSRANRWADLAERGYLNARGLKFTYGTKA